MINNIIDLLNDASIKYKNKTIYYSPSYDKSMEDFPHEISFGSFNDATLSIGTGILLASIKASKEISHNASQFCPTAQLKKPIVVMTGRHLYTPACYLGIARANYVYAPIDMDSPDNRIKQILSVANPEFIIADRTTLPHVEDILESNESYSILLLEDLLETNIDADLLENARSYFTEYSPLYMIFTSGSTGIPKGVLTSHYSLMCYLDGLNQVIRLDEADTLGNQAPLDYIAAIRDMYLPLLTGCSTVIIPRNITAMPTEVFDVLNKYQVTTLCWSASGLEVLARLGAFDSDNRDLPKSLKRIVFSGSVISSSILSEIQRALPGCDLINQYGPTESTASCTYYRIKGTVEKDTVIPIGKPFDHYKVFLLGDNNNDVPPGDIGEICVAGPALALGYYNDLAQTEKSFTINPLIKEYPERIYRTGDLGKYDQNGNLLFCGRKDRQIKHMGHRIELEEIEIKALELTGVDQAAALYDGSKSVLYLFYIGAAAPKDITIEFRQQMPPYMVPRKIVKLDEMPLLPNGKTNMTALKEYIK